MSHELPGAGKPDRLRTPEEMEAFKGMVALPIKAQTAARDAYIMQCKAEATAEALGRAPLTPDEIAEEIAKADPLPEIVAGRTLHEIVSHASTLAQETRLLGWMALHAAAYQPAGKLQDQLFEIALGYEHAANAYSVIAAMRKIRREG